MTDISTIGPLANRRLTLPRPALPRPALPGLAIGALLVDMCELVSDAFRLAYAAPFAGLHRRPEVTPEDGIEGRDPSW